MRLEDFGENLIIGYAAMEYHSAQQLPGTGLKDPVCVLKNGMRSRR